MDRFDDDTFFAELRELRPKPRPEFVAGLDQRAAAGFPRRVRPSTTSLPFALLADRWREASVRGRLVPVLSVALAALAVATVVVAIATSGGAGSGHSIADSISGTAQESGSSGVYAEEASSGAGEAAPNGAAGHKATGHGGNSSNGAGGGGISGETVYEPEVPQVEGESRRSPSKAKAAGTVAGGEEEGAEVEEEAAAGGTGESSAAEAESAVESESTGSTYAPIPPAGAKSSAGAGGRDIERSSYIVLGTKPDEISGASAKIYEAVHAADGVVLHSSVRSGSTGQTGATFALLIPTAKVSDALSAISQIAEVRERHDATKDITAPTVSATEELRDSNASIEGLLKELGNVETEAERESVESQLREERHHHAAIRASLDNLHERASMSEVSVRIVTSKRANVTPPAKSSNGGGWGIGDALHDAGHILTIAAGVLLIALAILAPIALIALLIWLANRFRVRRLRERALG